MLIDMLRRPEGATIAQIIAATGWQAHTVRGAFAGALKRKRGLTVTSEKPDGGERVYRTAAIDPDPRWRDDRRACRPAALRSERHRQQRIEKASMRAIHKPSPQPIGREF